MAINKKTAEDILKKRNLNGVNGVNVTFKELYEATDNIEARLDDLEDGVYTSIDLNGNADALILDADGDTTISAPTDDQIDIEIAGADDFTFTANAFNVLAGSKILSADTTDSTTKDTGSIITDGGIGVEKNIGLGADLKLEKEVSHTISVTTSTTLNAAGGDLSVTSGNGNGSGNGGALNLTTGGSTSGDSGAALVATSRALGGNSGDVIVQTGLDATDGGSILLKPNENTVVTISNNTVEMAASTVTKFPDGAVGALPVQFGADGNNGFYGVSDTQLGVAVEGAQVANFDTEGFKADSVQNRALLGTAGTNCTVKEYGDGRDITTVITLTNVDMGAPTAGAASAVGALIYTFPAGAHCHMVSYMSVGVTIGTVTTDTPDVGVGSVIASGATALLSGTATFEDYITGQTAADSAGTATVKTATATAGALTGISLNEAASAKTIHINAADTWDAGITGNLTATGTVTLKWTRLSA